MSIASITRRTFLRGCCILAGGLAFSVHMTGRAIAGVRELRQQMEDRIASVYLADRRSYVRRASQDNVQVIELYKKFLEKPLSEKAEHLLHTKWTDRSKTLTQLHNDKLYPGPRGGEFAFKKYPFEQ